MAPTLAQDPAMSAEVDLLGLAGLTRSGDDDLLRTSGQQAWLPAPVTNHHLRAKADGGLQRAPDPAPAPRRVAQPGVRVVRSRRQGQVGVGRERQNVLVPALIQ